MPARHVSGSICSRPVSFSTEIAPAEQQSAIIAVMNLDPLPRIATERLVLRQLTGEDVHDLFAIFGDQEVTRYWSSPALETRAAATALLAQIDEGRRTGKLFQWGIALAESDEVVGTTTLYEWERAHRRAALGYALQRSQWRRGLVAEAVSALIRFAFNELGLHRLEADVDPRNTASVRSLERLGFSREGHQRERYRVLDEWQDSWMYGLLRSDWASREKGE